MKTYKWTVEFEVDATWVAGGFNLTDERAHSMLTNTLPYAYDTELKARVIKAPSNKSIASEQGYKTVKAFLES